MATDLYYGDSALSGRVFLATAIVTAPVIFSTNTGTGGPLLVNRSTNVLGRLLKVGWAVTTASTAAGALGLTGGTGQTAAPAATTAIDSVTNCYMGKANGPLITPYRVGTPTTAGAWFYPLGQVGTTALTALPDVGNWIDLGRLFTIPPNGGWMSICGSATLSTAVLQIGVIWEEVDLP